MSKSNELPSKRQEESRMPKTKAQNNSFTQISNDILRDERLSFKARGILALLLSRPKNWKIYIDEIVERSDADGRHAVRTGFKELKDLGYVNLVRVWNKETGKFEGTVYQLCIDNRPKEPSKKKPSQKKLATLTDFPKDDETDLPKIRPTENLKDDKSDRLKTITPNNTKHSNTEYSNIKIQQQQVKNDAADFLKSKVEFIRQTETSKTATAFLPYLQQDENWKKQFVGKNICKQIETTEILTVAKFDLLLKHFHQTAISSGTTYANIAAIKRHFFNWFNANLNKNALPNYIKQQTKIPKNTCKRVAVLIPKTDTIVNKIYTQQCDNEAHLYRCLQLLETHLAVYENAVNILDDENNAAIKTWILDIQKAKNMVERGRKAGKLNWFFKRTNLPSKTRKPQPASQTEKKARSKDDTNSVITNLSQRFQIEKRHVAQC